MQLSILLIQRYPYCTPITCSCCVMLIPCYFSWRYLHSDKDEGTHDGGGAGGAVLFDGSIQ